MTDHDLTPDLEALLADAATGDLDPEEAERLRAAIAERPWLADLVDEQRTIAGRLAPEPVTGLTDLERSRLRRSVLDQVTERAPAAAASPRPMPWARWAFAAAAAAVVVVVASVGLLSGRLGDEFAPISQEITSASDEAADRVATGDAEEEFATSEAAVPEADLGADEADDAAGGADAADGAEESAIATPSCPTPGRSVDDLVGQTFETQDEARTAAEAADSAAFGGEPDPIDEPGGITWVWRDEDGSVTGILELVTEGDGWRVARAEACA